MKRLILTGAIALACSSVTATAADKTYDLPWRLTTDAGELVCSVVSNTVTLKNFNSRIIPEGGLARLSCKRADTSERPQNVSVGLAEDPGQLTAALLQKEGGEQVNLTFGEAPKVFDINADEEFHVSLVPVKQAQEDDAGDHVTRVHVVNEFS